MARVLSGFLADTSALARADKPEVAERLGPLMRGQRIATCTIVALELGRGTRSSRHHQATLLQVETIYLHVDIGQATLDRAAEVQAALARRGHHRGVPVADLVIAAAAVTYVATAPDTGFDDVGELDAKLLTGELPIDAFLDEDFSQWLKSASGNF